MGDKEWETRSAGVASSFSSHSPQLPHSANKKTSCDDRRFRIRPCTSGDLDLEHVQDEVIPPVVRVLAGVEVVPIGVVDRDSPGVWIPVVQVIVTLRLLLKVVGVIDVRVMVETIPVCWLSWRSRLGRARKMASRHEPSYEAEDDETGFHGQFLVGLQWE